MIELDAALRERARDLRLEMFARHDDDGALDVALGEQRVHDARGKARFSGARRRDDQRVLADGSPTTRRMHHAAKRVTVTANPPTAKPPRRHLYSRLGVPMLPRNFAPL